MLSELNRQKSEVETECRTTLAINSDLTAALTNAEQLCDQLTSSNRILQQENDRMQVDGGSARQMVFQAQQVSLSLSLRVCFSLTGVLVVSCFMWSDTSDTSDALQLYSVVSLASHITTILISPLF